MKLKKKDIRGKFKINIDLRKLKGSNPIVPAMIDIIKDKADYWIKVKEADTDDDVVISQQKIAVTAEELLILLKKLKEREESLKKQTKKDAYYPHVK